MFVEPLVLSVSVDSAHVFKARVDPSWPTLCSRLRVMIFSQHNVIAGLYASAVL